MNWRGNITANEITGYYKHDLPYCTYGKINTKEEAMKRCTRAFIRLKLSLKTHKINIYESSI